MENLQGNGHPKHLSLECFNLFGGTSKYFNFPIDIVFKTEKLENNTNFRADKKAHWLLDTSHFKFARFGGIEKHAKICSYI